MERSFINFQAIMRGLPLLEFFKHSLVCKACLKCKEGGNRDVFAYTEYQEIFNEYVFGCRMMNV